MKKSTQETANKLENRLNEKVASLDRKIETKISFLDSKIEIKINNLEKSIANILEIQKQILKNQEIEI